MGGIVAIAFAVMLFCLFMQFARQETVEDYFEEIVLDVEGRLEWARALRKPPFGMRSQLDVCRERLARAKNLWGNNRWHQACEVARKFQEAMNRAQDLYTSLYVAPANRKRSRANRKR